MQLMPPCLQPAADAADASCALLVCLAIGAKSKLPKPKLYPILAALKPCAAYNLSQKIARAARRKSGLDLVLVVLRYSVGAEKITELRAP